MRIIAGKHKGRLFCAPKGNDVRPTTDRVRESMFSSILSIVNSFEGLCVLDAFAGSGALGLESMSRGATTLFAFEKDRYAFNNLINNYKILDDSKINYKAICTDVKKCNFKMLPINIKFKLLFFDPPYKDDASDVLKILNKLKFDHISDNALVVYEHSKKDNFSEMLDLFKDSGFCKTNGKIYGEIAVEYLIYKRGNNE